MPDHKLNWSEAALALSMLLSLAADPSHCHSLSPFEFGVPSGGRGCLARSDFRLSAGTAAVSEEQQQLPDPDQT